jgi:hypothetical protein
MYDTSGTSVRRGHFIREEQEQRKRSTFILLGIYCLKHVVAPFYLCGDARHQWGHGKVDRPRAERRAHSAAPGSEFLHRHNYPLALAPKRPRALRLLAVDAHARRRLSLPAALLHRVDSHVGRGAPRVGIDVEHARRALLLVAEL